MSLKNTPRDTAASCILAGSPQTLNEKNNFGNEMLHICNNASKSNGNSVVLNISSNGALCEVEDNMKLTRYHSLVPMTTLITTWIS